MKRTTSPTASPALSASALDSRSRRRSCKRSGLMPRRSERLFLTFETAFAKSYAQPFPITRELKEGKDGSITSAGQKPALRPLNRGQTFVSHSKPVSLEDNHRTALRSLAPQRSSLFSKSRERSSHSCHCGQRHHTRRRKENCRRERAREKLSEVRWRATELSHTPKSSPSRTTRDQPKPGKRD